MKTDRLKKQAQRAAVRNRHPVGVFAFASLLYVVALYGRAALAGFFPYDDPGQITANPRISSLGSSLFYFRHAVPFTNDLVVSGSSLYRPLFWMSLALDNALWGLNATAFHLSNIGLFWLTGFLLFLLLRRLGVSFGVAAGAVILWFSLPINSEAVAWISDRAYCLAGCFVCAAGLFAWRFFRSGRLRFSLGYAACLFGGLLTHEAGILAVPLAFLIGLSIGAPSRKSIAVLSGASLVPLAAFLFLKRTVAGSMPLGFGNLAPVGTSFFKYVSWIVLPIHMSVERSTDTPPGVWTPIAILSWVGLLALCALIFVYRHRFPRICAGAAWLAIALLPFCGTVRIYQGMAERFAYFAAPGFALVVSAALAMLPWAKMRARPTSSPGALLLLTLVLSWGVWGLARLWIREGEWDDPVALYESSLRANPSSAKLFHNLGDVYLNRGDLNEARESYTRSLELSPQDVAVAVNLGVTLQREGDKAGAEKAYARAIQINPAYEDAYCNLGTLLVQAHEVQRAEALFKKAIDLNGTDPVPVYDLAAIYDASGRKDLAVTAYRRVLQLSPNDPDATSALTALGAGQTP